MASMVHRPRLELGCSKERQVYSLLAVHPAMRCKMEEAEGFQPPVRPFGTYAGFQDRCNMQFCHASKLWRRESDSNGWNPKVRDVSSVLV